MNIEQFDHDVNSYKDSMIYFFNLWNTVDTKINLIASYLDQSNIKDVVIGISGGIDSAVVLALLTQVKKQHIHDLKIHGYCITFDQVYGNVFDPKYVELLQQKFCEPDISIDILDCTSSLNSMVADLQLPRDKQLLAQVSYALRYQMFFAYAQLYKGVTFGTTNRDEFEYVGWFGKNSDMVVDFQCITDWHKFLVIEAAHRLGVPQQIIDRVPTGDLIDNSSDEDNFGCTYDQLAYFGSLSTMSKCRMRLGDIFYDTYKKVLDLHQKNIHKYQGQTFNPFFIK